MKRHILLLSAIVGTASLLVAGDFWDKKKFPDWSAKDAQKMLKESPWARPVEMGGGTGVGSGRGSGRGRGGGAPGPVGAGGIPDASTGGATDSLETSAGGGAGAAGVMAIIRWQSALP